MKATLYAGAGLALAVGLVVGVTLRPRLAEDDAARVPQTPVETPVASIAPQAPAPVDESQAVARYGDRIPEYVLGSDLRKLARAAAGPAMLIPPDPQTYYVSPLGHPPPAATDAAVDASAMVDGQPVVLPVAANDDEATPEAAGDTRVEH